MHTTNGRIQVSHVGSLPRPQELRQASRARLEQGGALDGFDDILTESVHEVVAKQHQVGITMPNDGGFGKSMGGKVDYGAWWSYSFQRLGGLELRDGGVVSGTDHVESSLSNVRLTNFANRRDWVKFAAAYQVCM